MKIGLITLLPEMFGALSDFGSCGRAIRDGLVDLVLINPRDYTADRHRTVDDKPFGGGPGMLMKTEPLVAAIRDARRRLGAGARVVYLSPQGRRVDQAMIVQAASEESIILVCGRYQGIDQRVLESESDEEWSLGDFVISGGEFAALLEGRGRADLRMLVRRLPSHLLAAYQVALGEHAGADAPLWEFYHRARLLLDFVSGLTDQLAEDEYRVLTAQ